MTNAQLNEIDQLVGEHGAVRLSVSMRGKKGVERYRLVTRTSCLFRFAGKLNKIYGPGWSKSCFVDKESPFSVFDTLMNMKDYDGKSRLITKIEVL